jgi:hypothetical protein
VQARCNRKFRGCVIRQCFSRAGCRAQAQYEHCAKHPVAPRHKAKALARLGFVASAAPVRPDRHPGRPARDSADTRIVIVTRERAFPSLEIVVRKISAFAACGALFVACLIGARAHADVVVSAENPNLCLDVNQSNNNVALWGCHGGVNQNFFTNSYGQQRFNGSCLDQSGPQQGAGLVMAPCANKPSQRWLLVSNPNDPSPGRLRNEAGWCANIPGGNARQGVQVIVWACQRGVTPNDMWGRGTFLKANAAGIPASALGRLNQVGIVYAPTPAGIVSAGAGNIVAAGAGNIVAAGAGNVIRMNSGAIVAAGAGNIVAAGAGN